MTETEQSPPTSTSGDSLLKAPRGSTGLYACGYTRCLTRHLDEVDALACARIRLAYEVRDLVGVDGERAASLAERCREFDEARPDVVMRAAQINAGRMVERLLEWQTTLEEAGGRLSRKERAAVRDAFAVLTAVERGESPGERTAPVEAFAKARTIFNKYLVKRSKGGRK